MPDAVQLRRTFLALMANLSSHWRLKSLKARQKLDFFASLVSGLSWTFLANTWFIIMLACLLLEEFESILAGGDDSAIENPEHVKADYNIAEKF